MTQEINRKLHEALGRCWHEPAANKPWYCMKCKDYFHHTNPDYCADPRLVIEAMMERKDWPLFLDYVGGDYYPPADPLAGNISLIDCNLILDKTGKLRDAAIEWLEVKG